MVTIHDVARAYAGRLADLYDERATWRLDRHDQFPDDPRNMRSSIALGSAADYVRAIKDPASHPVIRRFAELAPLLDMWRGTPMTAYVGYGNLDNPTVVPDPGRPEEVITAQPGDSSSRFFFDNGQRDPTPSDFEYLLKATFYETLERWREMLEFLPDTDIPEPLAAFFAEHGVPLHDDGDDDA